MNDVRTKLAAQIKSAEVEGKGLSLVVSQRIKMYKARVSRGGSTENRPGQGTGKWTTMAPRVDMRLRILRIRRDIPR